MKITEQAFSLVELILFIVLLGLATAALIPLNLIPANISRLDSQAIAIQLAQQRMELILTQRYSQGFSSFADPCFGASPPTACILPSGYSIATPTISTISATNKRITVTVGGKGDASIETEIFKNSYEN